MCWVFFQKTDLCSASGLGSSWWCGWLRVYVRLLTWVSVTLEPPASVYQFSLLTESNYIFLPSCTSSLSPECSRTVSSNECSSAVCIKSTQCGSYWFFASWFSLISQYPWISAVSLSLISLVLPSAAPSLAPYSAHMLRLEWGKHMYFWSVRESYFVPPTSSSSTGHRSLGMAHSKIISLAKCKQMQMHSWMVWPGCCWIGRQQMSECGSSSKRTPPCLPADTALTLL